MTMKIIKLFLNCCGKGDYFFLCRFFVVQLSGDLTFVDNEDAVAHAVHFEEAGKFIIEKEKASIGMLQRMFKIGFNRAARIMDQDKVVKDVLRSP